MPYLHHSFDFTETDDIDGFVSLSLERPKWHCKLLCLLILLEEVEGWNQLMLQMLWSN